MSDSSDFERYNGEFVGNTQNGIRLFNKILKLPGNCKANIQRAEVRDGAGPIEAYAGAEATDHGTGVWSAGAGAGIAYVDGDDSFLHSRANANAEFGLLGGAIAEAGVDAAVYRNQTKEGRVSVGEFSLGGGVGVGHLGAKAKVDANIDLVHAAAKLGDIGTVEARLGLNASTGFDVGAAGFGFSFLGLGLSVGRTTGISTPFGGFSFNL